MTSRGRRRPVSGRGWRRSSKGSRLSEGSTCGRRSVQTATEEAAILGAWASRGGKPRGWRAGRRGRGSCGGAPAGCPVRSFQLESADAVAELREWARPPYDLVWCSHLTAYACLGGARMGPTVVDLDNLWDVALRHRREAERRNPSISRARRSMRAPAVHMADRVDEGRYRRLQRRVASQVDVVTVCSELDRSRLDVRNALVVPNAYRAPTPAGELRRAECRSAADPDRWAARLPTQRRRRSLLR